MKRLNRHRAISLIKTRFFRRFSGDTPGTTAASKESQKSNTKKEILKDDSSEKNKKDEDVLKYWKTNGYRIFVVILIFINLAAWCRNLWLYTYLSLPLFYNFYQIVLAKSGFILSVIALIIPATITKWLSSRKNKEGFQVKDIAVYSGTLLAIFLIFSWAELMTYNFPEGIESDDYLYRLSEANNYKTCIPGFVLPIKTAGVRIGSSEIEKNFEFGYNKDNYSLKLKNIENTEISTNAEQLTADFLNKNKEQIVKLIVDKQIDRVDIEDYLISKLSAGDFMQVKKKDGSFLGNRWITGIILVEFIKSHWHWGIFQDWAKDEPGGGYYKMLIGWIEKHLSKNGAQHGTK